MSHRVGHSMGNRVSHSMDQRGSMSHSHRVGNSMGHRDSLGVRCSAIIGHISNIAIDGVRVVVDMLDPAIRKSHRVGALSIASSITGLSSIEVGVGVVISNGVVVGVGAYLVGIDLSRGSMGHSMNHRGSMDDRSSMDQWGSMSNNRVGNSVSHRVGGKHWGMGHNACDTASVGNIGVVGNSSHTRSKGLGLDSCSMLSLERLRDRLVRGLTSSTDKASMEELGGTRSCHKQS